MSLCFLTRLEFSRRWCEPTAGTPWAVCLFVYGLGASWCLTSACEQWLIAGEWPSRPGGPRFLFSRGQLFLMVKLLHAELHTSCSGILFIFLDFYTAVLMYIRKQVNKPKKPSMSFSLSLSFTHAQTHTPSKQCQLTCSLTPWLCNCVSSRVCGSCVNQSLRWYQGSTLRHEKAELHTAPEAASPA